MELVCARPDTGLSSLASLCLQREQGAAALRTSRVSEQTDQIPNLYYFTGVFAADIFLYSSPEQEKKNPGGLLKL